MSVVPLLIARQATHQRLLDRFRTAGATAPERARTAAELGIVAGEHGTLGELRAAGVVRTGARETTFYLDEVALIERRNRPPGRNLLGAIIALLVLMLGALIAGGFLGNR